MSLTISCVRYILLVGCYGVLCSGEDIVTYTEAGVMVERRDTDGQHRRVKREVNRDMSGFNHEEKLAILRKHNQLRRTQLASDMMYLEWDDRLADSAQEWVDLCDFRRSNDRQGLAGYPYVGENMYGDTHKFDPAAVVQYWFDEINYYNYKTRGCTDVCGHYTQVVWATSRAIGCGVKYCPVLKGFDGATQGYQVACHYGPGGNYAGEKPFYVGEPCSKCPLKFGYCVKGLCSLRPKIGANGGNMFQIDTLVLTVYVAIVGFMLLSSR
ncbi:hypothetical protein RRG08_046720 [Elysia crispata]|uniref:SCP domain-containing protein n=1 Tax=Elysia crispata TaxID=231223 RepID=A0AAE1DNM3_9GAST|nr:hypothetical protein RRG08_046720 [Elysia crispata]